MKIAKKLLIPVVFLAVLSSCHPDETYYCYLVEGDVWDRDTISSYSEGFWIHKKRSKPEDECAEDAAYQDSINSWDWTYDCGCICGWEPD